VGLYAEAMGIGMPTTGDGLLNKGPGDGADGRVLAADARQKGRAGLRGGRPRGIFGGAHLWQADLAATESFTTGQTWWRGARRRFYLKGLADQAFSRGINRIIFHTSDQQPFVDDAHKPGMTLGFFGQHYTRNITWAEQAVAWNTYLARCSYLACSRASR
jgi:hypothetical protein